MLDDLRQAALNQDDDPLESHQRAVAKVEDDRLFGMTALERMFLSVGLFGITLVISMLLLIVTDSIAFNF
jgi:hypothetical protein